MDVPWPRRTGRRRRPSGRSGAATHHGRDAREKRLVDLLRADEMNVRIHSAGGDDLALARDDFRPRPNDDRYTRLYVGIARLADGGNEPVPDRDVGLDDSPVIEDQRIGNDRI